MLVDDIALTLQPEIGPKTAIHLIDCFGSAETLYATPAEEITRKSQLKLELAKALTRKSFHRQAEQEIAFLEKHDIHALVATSPDYPALLKECPDYPHVLYLKGDPSLFGRRMLSFAGTRSITSYGLKMCEELIFGLATLIPDLVIVSGLSAGTDTACHRAALDAGIPTLGVLPNALTHIYPSHNTNMAREMVRHGGGILTEYHSQFTPHASVFLQRNRLIAGLTPGTVIVESPAESGSLTTADFALGYDRCLMAVPGRVTDPASTGTNNLIKQLKARMVCSAYDIIRELDWKSVESTKKGSAPETQELDLSKDERGLLSCFRDREIVSSEELIEWSGLSPAQLAPLLLGLEMAGAIRTLPGNRYEKIIS